MLYIVVMLVPLESRNILGRYVVRFEFLLLLRRDHFHKEMVKIYSDICDKIFKVSNFCFCFVWFKVELLGHPWSL